MYDWLFFPLLFGLIILLTAILYLSTKQSRCNSTIDSFKTPDFAPTNDERQLAVYSVFIGAKNNVANRIPRPFMGFPCFYFSNNRDTLRKAKHMGWVPIYEKATTDEDDPVFNNLDAKKYKVRPHLHPILRRFRFLLFLDSKKNVNQNKILQFISRHGGEAAMFMIPHPCLDHPFLQNEVVESMHQKRYADQKEQIERYIQAQGIVPEPAVFYQMPVILRNMHHPKTKEIGEMWHRHIQQCGIQDQISFYFVHHRFAESIKPLPNVIIGCEHIPTRCWSRNNC